MCGVVILFACRMSIITTVTVTLACVFTCTFTQVFAFVAASMHTRARAPRTGVDVAMQVPEDVTDLDDMLS